MVAIHIFITALTVVSSANAAPHFKRIAQVIADSTTKWEAACNTAGGGEQCNPTAVNAFGTLLAAAGPCDQQNAADTMVDLAKQLNNDPNMIKFAQLFAQQPRNSPNSVSVPYCQSAPKNSELNGLFQCQFQGVDPKTFVGGIAVGQPGTIPFGMSSAVNPPLSCPAHTSGGIADGTQLTDITSDPGVGSTNTGSGSSSSGSAKSTPSATSQPKASSVAPSSTAVAPTASTSSTGSSSFALQNGKDAQALNAKFATLTADSSCTDDEQACVGTAFAQCVSGKFVTTDCGSGLTCAALPLVNSAGTSITCTTTQDAISRIDNTGATGGLTGSS